MKLVFDGKKFTRYVGKKAKGGTFTIDPTKKPKNIDLTHVAPDGSKVTFPAIYQIDGDTLKFGQSTGVVRKRPTDFDNMTGVAVLILKREKEKAN